MLIPSDRHRPDDLSLWAELAEADLIWAESPAHRARVAHAEALIGRFLNRGKRHFVATSWGKDSVVVVDLFRRAGVRPRVVWVRQLDNENPGSPQVRDAYLQRFGDEIDYEERAYSYLRGAEPSWYYRGRPRRWFQVLRELQRDHGCHVTGIRPDESSQRKLRFDVFGPETLWSFAPLVRLRNADVFAYLASRGLPIHSAYAMLGGGRWPRDRLRVTAIGNREGTGAGRREWEQEYYGDVLRRMEAGRPV